MTVDEKPCPYCDQHRRRQECIDIWSAKGVLPACAVGPRDDAPEREKRRFREWLDSGGEDPAMTVDEVGRLTALAEFQTRVDAWMDACFGPAIKADVQERCDRFIEEALEFVQAAGYSADRAHALVDYTFGRPVGEINQEVGGVMVTLAAMCNTLDVDIGAASETELARVWTKIDKIRAKQLAKPTGSALPIADGCAALRARSATTQVETPRSK